LVSAGRASTTNVFTAVADERRVAALLSCVRVARVDLALVSVEHSKHAVDCGRGSPVHVTCLWMFPV
jgi:hypothetical protein